MFLKIPCIYVSVCSEELQSRVSQCEFSERHALSKLQVTQAELDKSKATVDTLNKQIEEMGERFGDMLNQNAEIRVKTLSSSLLFFTKDTQVSLF